MTAVESAIVLSTFLLLLFIVLDLGIAAFQYNSLAAAARHVARSAIVRGADAAPEYAEWGPDTYTGNVADGSEIANAAGKFLATMQRSDIAVELAWPDGDNQQGDRVRARLAYQHHPLVPLVSFVGALNLQSECEMRIVH